MTIDKFTVNKKLAEQLSLLNLKGIKTKKPSINAGLLMYGGGGEILPLKPIPHIYQQLINAFSSRSVPVFCTSYEPLICE